MGRRVFTRKEADEIRRLLREKGIADRTRQKSLRSRLRRRFDFYISDFTGGVEGFTASDFDELVARGTIEISGDLRSETRRKAPRERVRPINKGAEEDAVLPDVLEPELRVVFCGMAVGTTSARAGAYYARPGNQFWAVLERVGLTVRQLSPEEFRELLRHGIGLTDLAKAVSGGDAEVAASEVDVELLRRKIEALAPRALAFNGKRAAETFLGRPVEYGRQSDTIGQTVVFVLPSTSGAARRYWDQSHWQDLADFVDSRERGWTR